MNNMEIAMIPYYYKFSDLNKVIYDLKEVKGLYIMDQPNCSPVDMELENSNDYMDYTIILCIGSTYKEFELYYKDKKTRDKDYDKLIEIFSRAEMLRGD